jgi:hypothetical protein
MASIQCHRSGVFRIRFRFGGREFMRSFRTAYRREAEALRGRVEVNLRLVERGRLEVPPDADIATFLLSDGKLDRRPILEWPVTLGELFRQYRELHPAGAKEDPIRYTEDIHIDHLTRILGADLAVRAVTTERLQAFVDARSAERGRLGRPVSHIMVKKEIGTLASIWNEWACPQGIVSGPALTKGLVYRKAKARPPFQTWEQIERQVARGGLTKEEERELWDCLFLDADEVRQLLEHVRVRVRRPYVHARRSSAPGSTTLILRLTRSRSARRRRVAPGR